MFMNTIAVGPFEPAESWVTGGATVAIARTATFFWRKQTLTEDVATAFPSWRDKSELRDIMFVSKVRRLPWKSFV